MPPPRRLVLQFDLRAIEQAVVGLAVGADVDLGLVLELPAGGAGRVAVVGRGPKRRETAQGDGKLGLCPVNRRRRGGAGKQSHP